MFTYSSPVAQAYKDFQQGLTIDDSPYPPGSDDELAWINAMRQLISDRDGQETHPEPDFDPSLDDDYYYEAAS